MAYFPKIRKIRYEGPDSKNPLAFKWYNEDEIVEGKTMKDHLRFSVVYWHTFRNALSDPFGVGTICARGTTVPSRSRTPKSELRSRSSSWRSSAHRTMPFMIATSRPRQEPLRLEQEFRRRGQGAQGRAGTHRHQAPLGHGLPCSPTRVTCTAPPQAATPTHSPTLRRR